MAPATCRATTARAATRTRAAPMVAGGPTKAARSAAPGGNHAAARLLIRCAENLARLSRRFGEGPAAFAGSALDAVILPML